MNGDVLSAEQVDEIARLPTRDVLYGRLVGMVASPLTGLASAMGGLIGGLARQLQQIADQGLVGGDAPRLPPRPHRSPSPSPSPPNADVADGDRRGAERPTRPRNQLTQED